MNGDGGPAHGSPVVDGGGLPWPDELGGGVLLVAEQLRRAVPGGIGTYVEGLVQGVRELWPAGGSQVTLLASRTRGVDPLDRMDLPVETVGLPSRALVKAWDAGAGRVGRGRSVVHATSMAVPPTSAPLVATVHDLAWRQIPEAYPPRGKRWHDAALRRTVRRAERLVVPSDEVAVELRERLPGKDADRVVVIGEGSDHLPAPDPEATQHLLRRLGVDSEFLLAVGTLEPRKNLQRLFDGYAAARPMLPEPWPLVVVGPAGWGDAARDAPTGVVLAGKVEPTVLAGLYASCRCLAYVPLLEGFGLPVVEAMRAGAPVVASRVPSAGGAAFEVDPLDVGAVADGLVTAATDGAARAALVAAGRAHTASMTWARTAARHVELWRALAAGGS